MTLALGVLLVVGGCLLAVWAIRKLLRSLNNDLVEMKDLVQEIPLPPRRSTVDIMANPRPLPGTLRINVHPAEDLDGQWVAEVQPVDIITQGNSMVQAIEAAAEAVQMCWEDDQANGLDFWERGAAWRAQCDRLEACSSENPCLDTEVCPRCRTFPSGSGG